MGRALVLHVALEVPELLHCRSGLLGVPPRSCVRSKLRQGLVDAGELDEGAQVLLVLLQLLELITACLLYTSPSPRDRTRSRMPSSA